MNKPELIKFVESQVERKEFPAFRAGDTITVNYKIKEGNKERIQSFYWRCNSTQGHRRHRNFYRS